MVGGRVAGKVGFSSGNNHISGKINSRISIVDTRNGEICEQIRDTHFDMNQQLMYKSAATEFLQTETTASILAQTLF